MHENHPLLKPTVHIDRMPLLKLLRPGWRRRGLQVAAIAAALLLLAGGGLGLAHGFAQGEDVFGACACDLGESGDAC